MPLTVRALGRMREGDVPPAAVDFHCSDVVKAVCKKITGAGAAEGGDGGGQSAAGASRGNSLAAAKEALSRAAQELGMSQEDVLIKAMWEFRSGVNARQALAGSTRRGEGARAELEDVWRESEGEVERWSTDFVSQKFL